MSYWYRTVIYELSICQSCKICSSAGSSGHGYSLWSRIPQPKISFSREHIIYSIKFTQMNEKVMGIQLESRIKGWNMILAKEMTHTTNMDFWECVSQNRIEYFPINCKTNEMMDSYVIKPLNFRNRNEILGHSRNQN